MGEDRIRRGCPPAFDRRSFLGGALALGAGALAAACGSQATIHQAATTVPAGSDLGAVDHVVFLMQENRSFDHYFGSYRGVRGFDDHPPGGLGAFAQPYQGNTTRRPAGMQLPFRLDVSTGQGECTYDLDHSWLPQHLCRNGGLDGRLRPDPRLGGLRRPRVRVADHGVPHPRRPAVPLRPGRRLHHLRRLPLLGHGADPPQPTDGPVRHHRSGRAARRAGAHHQSLARRRGSAWTGPRSPSCSRTPVCRGRPTTPPGDLYQHHQSRGDAGLRRHPPVLQAVLRSRRPRSTSKAFLPTFPDDFAARCGERLPPRVSWIIPPLGYDEHPPAPPNLGAWFIDQVLQTLVSNPAVWSKTVLFVMYDENDGFFDHVPPPVAPPGTTGRVRHRGSTARRRPTASPAHSDWASGCPMLVVSPFSRGGYVASEVLDHTSQIRFLEERFGIRASEISAWRRDTVGDLTSTLAHGHRPIRPPHGCPSTSIRTRRPRC